MSKTLILSHNEISLKLDRIAWQILEEHYNETNIVLIGLLDRGANVAEKIKLRMQKHTRINLISTTINVDKSNPLSSKAVIGNSSIIKNNPIILVDDVLNSGITMAGALKEVLAFNPKSVQTAVLANRDHHKFPIQANFVGISIATTLKEHITYSELEGEMEVTLN